MVYSELISKLETVKIYNDLNFGVLLNDYYTWFCNRLKKYQVCENNFLMNQLSQCISFNSNIGLYKFVEEYIFNTYTNPNLFKLVILKKIITSEELLQCEFDEKYCGDKLYDSLSVVSLDNVESEINKDSNLIFKFNKTDKQTEKGYSVYIVRDEFNGVHLLRTDQYSIIEGKKVYGKCISSFLKDDLLSNLKTIKKSWIF